MSKRRSGCGCCHRNKGSFSLRILRTVATAHGLANPSSPSRLKRWGAALCTVLALSGIALPYTQVARAAEASPETVQKLNDAEAQLKEVQQHLDDISKRYTELAQEEANTLEDIEEVQGSISQVEDSIEKRYAELKTKQGALADRVATTYKSGTKSLLALVLSSSSFTELTSNIYYANKVTETDVALIDDVRSAKQALESDRMELKEQEASLQALKEEQDARLAEMQAQQTEAEESVANLSQEVKDLMEKRDAELAAAIEAEKRQREEQERRATEAQAQAQAQANQSTAQNNSSAASQESSSSANSETQSSNTNQSSEASPSDTYTSKGSAIVAAAPSVPSPGGGLCAMWVSQVYQAALGYYPGGNANDMYARCSSSNRADLQPGMAIAVSTHPHTQAGSIYGHVGIYMGNNTVMDNVGYVRTIGLDEWISYYGVSVPVRWGWI